MNFLIATIIVLCSGHLSAASEAALECVPYVKVKVPSIIKSLTAPQIIKVPENEVKFLLFTRQNQNCFQELKSNHISESFFNPQWPTRFIIHGWRNNAFSGVNRKIKDAYLTKGNYNVIVVDWSGLSSDVNYNQVSKYVDRVGQIVADFAEVLHQDMRVSYDEMYLIGHSLGAQVAGYAGHVAKQKFNTMFALDPAAPNFKVSKNQSRIDKESAKYVESIHTDMGFAGEGRPVGHAAFFPNYGKKQEGCRMFTRCSHSRAYKYFAESLYTENGFWGLECGSLKEIKDKHCVPVTGELISMGGDPSTPKTGLYYLPTNDEEPYAKGKQF